MDGALVVVSHDACIADKLANLSLANISADPFPCADSARNDPSYAALFSSRSLTLGAPGSQQIVIALSFTSTTQFASCLLRPHVHYEGRALKGPLKGVNFPTCTLVSWLHSLGQISDVTPAEASILETCIGDDWGKRMNSMDATVFAPFKASYIIAHLANDRSTFIHEWAHAVFYLDPGYKQACASVFEDTDAVSEKFKTHVTKELTQWNYSPDVVLDEFQAYIVEGPVTVFGKKWMGDVKLLQQSLRTQLGEIPK
ncbi:hypothetical protein BC830DRAFT_1144710 [Chytriomyces sp. MP71]|nr:hypothetical protein BC830DRAFT_1144710 [Chytriomyces sp. MP71]